MSSSSSTCTTETITKVVVIAATEAAVEAVRMIIMSNGYITEIQTS